MYFSPNMCDPGDETPGSGNKKGIKPNEPCHRMNTNAEFGTPSGDAGTGGRAYVEIHIKGGMAEVITITDGVVLKILDFDVMKDGEPAEEIHMISA